MPTRAEHRRQTLLKLNTAAIDLFEAEGPSVTIDAIAKQAGVARRTVFRYVDAKEELAYLHPVIWFDVFDAALAKVADEPLADRLCIASHAIAEYIDTDPGPPKRAFLVGAMIPELGRGFSALFQRWVDRIAQEVLNEGDPADQQHRLRSRIIGSTVMGMVDASMREWVMSPPGTSFADLYDKGFTIVAPLFREETDSADD